MNIFTDEFMDALAERVAEKMARKMQPRNVIIREELRSPYPWRDEQVMHVYESGCGSSNNSGWGSSSSGGCGSSSRSYSSGNGGCGSSYTPRGGC